MTACRSCGSYAATRPDLLCDGCGAAVDGGAPLSSAYVTDEDYDSAWIDCIATHEVSCQTAATAWREVRRHDGWRRYGYDDADRFARERLHVESAAWLDDVERGARIIEEEYASHSWLLRDPPADLAVRAARGDAVSLDDLLVAAGRNELRSFEESEWSGLCGGSVVAAFIERADAKIAERPATKTTRGRPRRPTIFYLLPAVGGGYVTVEPDIVLVRSAGGQRWETQGTISVRTKPRAGARSLTCRFERDGRLAQLPGLPADRDAVHLQLGIVMETLESFAADPAAWIAAGGESTHCAMCGRALTDQASRLRGVGPECAKQADALFSGIEAEKRSG
jgi:hypothetical protein